MTEDIFDEALRIGHAGDATAKAQSGLKIMLRAAVWELSCERCSNNGHVTTGNGDKDECPRCYGNMKNVATIALLNELTARVDRLAKAQSND